MEELSGNEDTRKGLKRIHASLQHQNTTKAEAARRLPKDELCKSTDEFPEYETSAFPYSETTACGDPR